jgi:chemosensory pili system protein ChpC
MSDDTELIKCVILTLRNENVIVPNAIVAEITSVKEVVESENAPEWFLGKMNWRGKDVPLLSFEAAAGEEISKVNLNTQAVVLYAVGKDGNDAESPYLGLVMSGVPHVSRFTREQIVTDSEDQEEHPMVAQKVRVNGARVSILDVDAMVSMVQGLAA